MKEEAPSSAARAARTARPLEGWGEMARAGTPGCRAWSRDQRWARRSEQGLATDLVDASLLGCNLGNGLAEDKDVVDAEGGDAGNDGRWDDVGRVVRSADSDLEDGGVNLKRAGLCISATLARGFGGR